MDERRKRMAARWAIFCALTVLSFARAEEPVILPLTMNGVARDEVFALVAEDGDVWVEIQTLTRAQVALGTRGKRSTREGRELISLRSLSPEVSYELDPEALTLSITVDPSLLGVTRFARSSTRPADLEVLPSAGGFLNYRATLARFEDVSAFADAGWSLAGHLLYSSATLDSDGAVRRAMTNLVIDQPERMRRFTVGDTFARTDQLGGALSLAGVTISREFLLDPYFVRYPSLDLTGAVTTPSTAEVYVNGALVERRQLPPGRFEIDQVSLPSGRGAATVVVRDAFGGSRTIVEPFYASSFVLEEGLSEYSYSAGFRRINEATESFDYDDPVGLAMHRWGVTSRVTAGYRAEATEDVWSAGGSVAVRSLAGEVSLIAGASEDDGESGSALSARYAYLTRSFSAALGWTEVSDSYATVSMPAALDRSTRRIEILTSVRRGRLDMGLNGMFDERRDLGSTSRAALTGAWPIAQRGTLFVTAGVAEIDDERSPELGFGITWNLGFLRSANLRFDRRTQQSSGGISVQQNLGREPGWGYQLDGGMTDEEDTSSVRVQRQTRDFLFEVDANPSIASDAVNVSAAGGLALGAGRAHLMRAAQQSYAIVRVPGVAGVRVYVSNLEAGRTNSKGELVVTDLIPYYGNRIRIEDADIPMQYRVGETERIVAPPLRGGVVVDFDVEPATSVGGVVQVVQPDGSVRIPATGEMRLRPPSGETAVSPLGRGAEFWFEDIAPGTYETEIVDETGICRMSLRIDESNEPMQDLGTLTCREVAP